MAELDKPREAVIFEGEKPEDDTILVHLGATTKELDVDLGPRIPHGFRFQLLIPEEDIRQFVIERGYEPTAERMQRVHQRLAMAGREAIGYAATYTNWKNFLK